MYTKCASTFGATSTINSTIQFTNFCFFPRFTSTFWCTETSNTWTSNRAFICITRSTSGNVIIIFIFLITFAISCIYAFCTFRLPYLINCIFTIRALFTLAYIVFLSTIGIDRTGFTFFLFLCIRKIVLCQTERKMLELVAIIKMNYIIMFLNLQKKLMQHCNDIQHHIAYIHIFALTYLQHMLEECTNHGYKIHFYLIIYCCCC